MLNAVEMMGPVDAPFAMNKLNEVVRAFNEVEAKGVGTPTPQILESVRYKDCSYTFLLNVDGVNTGDFYLALIPLVDVDP